MVNKILGFLLRRKKKFKSVTVVRPDGSRDRAEHSFWNDLKLIVKSLFILMITMSANGQVSQVKVVNGLTISSFTATVPATIGGSITVTPGTGTWTTSESAYAPGAPTTITCAASSTAVLAASSTRKAVECRATRTNTTDLFIRQGAAATTSDFPLEPSDYWLFHSTVAVNCISVSGSPEVRCIPYF